MMPAYNFQSQFVPMIRDGSKHHTIRRRRKRPTVPGDWLWLYTGQRTKDCELVYEGECTSVVPVKIYPYEHHVFLDGKRLVFDDMVRFAKSDGFKNIYEFLDFFKRYTAYVREHDLEVIYWR